LESCYLSQDVLDILTQNKPLGISDVDGSQ